MKEPYLEVTYRRGKAVEAYYLSAAAAERQELPHVAACIGPGRRLYACGKADRDRNHGAQSCVRDGHQPALAKSGFCTGVPLRSCTSARGVDLQIFRLPAIC